jgi:hypothetical protein
MDKSNPAQTSNGLRARRPAVGDGQFGEYDATGVGTDLTLEWDSNDPDLHAHMREFAPANELTAQRSWIASTSDDEDRYRHFHEAGIPDA